MAINEVNELKRNCISLLECKYDYCHVHKIKKGREVEIKYCGPIELPYRYELFAYDFIL